MSGSLSVWRRGGRAVICSVLATTCWVCGEAARAGQTVNRDDDPVFGLVLAGFDFNQPEVVLSGPVPTTMDVRARRPFPSAAAAVSLLTLVNGEAAAIAEVAMVREGLDYRSTYRFTSPRLGLKSGRNEVLVTIASGATRHEASFVVHIEPSADARAQDMARESRRQFAGDDAEAPLINVSEPTSVSMAGTTVTVAGRASDNRGVAGVWVLGQPADIAAAKGGANAATAVEFRARIDIPAGTTQLPIEVRDGSGNVARTLLRVAAPEPIVSSSFRGRKAALLVGVQEYRHGLQGLAALEYPRADVKAMFNHLVDPQLGGFAPNDVRTLIDDQATKDGVDFALRALTERLDREDLLFVYINAHGAADPYGTKGPAPFYFVLHDTRVSDLARTGLSMDIIARLVGAPRGPGHVVILIDACHSGAALERVSAASRALDGASRALIERPGVALMTSSAAGESSWERKDLGHGVFTFALLEGLRGGADRDGNGLITAGELFTATVACVRQLMPGQNPHMSSGTLPDLSIARVPPATRNPARRATGSCG